MIFRNDDSNNNGNRLSYFNRLWHILTRLSDHLGWISGALTIVMLLAVTREVVGRYFLNNPSDWSIELTCYLVVAMSYLAAPYTELKEKHIRVDVLYGIFKGRVKLVADIIIFIAGFIWSSVLVWQGGILALHSLKTSARSETIMSWPLFPSQVMVPIGAFLLILILIGKIVRDINKGRGY
jgi:TRAP-type mannitol/chloroaromatic compound transport system permease small subunit